MIEVEERTTNERLQFGVPVDAAKNAPAEEGDIRQTSSLTKRLWLETAVFRVPKHGADSTLIALEKDRDLGSGFLFIPVFLAIGALGYFVWPQEPGWMPLMVGAVLFSGASAVLHSRPLLRALMLFCLVTLIGALAAKLETWRVGTPMLGSEITTVLTGRVASLEYQASGRVRLTLDVVETKRPQLRYAPDRVRATARRVPASVRPGDMVEGVVRLMPPSGPLRPQSYDFAFNSYFSGIGGNGFFMSDVELVHDMQPPTVGQRFNSWVEDWRLRMAQRISSQIGGSEGAIAAALITGIRAGIPEEINEALRITGLYHVISISGLHMALVGGTVMIIMRTAFAFWPGISMRRPVKKYAAATALVVTALYLFISGADVAAQRSFLMLGVMLVAILFDRSALTMRNLAISAIIILLVAPHEIVGPSFQMSFAATAALVATYATWTNWRSKRKRFAPQARGSILPLFGSGLKYAAGLSMTSIIAGGATALFTAWHFQQVSPMGLFANLAAMPFVSVIVMPMAVLAALLMPVGLDGPPLQLMGLGISAMNAVALWLAERSAYDATGVISLSSVVVLTMALAILTMSASAIRWVAAPLVLLGGILLVDRNLPDVLISEDASLVAVRLADNRLAVNRPRPRAFTFQNWQRAVNAKGVLFPSKDTAPHDGFSCAEGLCIVNRNGIIVVHAVNGEKAETACAFAHLIIINDATASNGCRTDVQIITKRDLAQKGSTEIRFALDARENDGSETLGSAHARVEFSIAQPYRPWHEHRLYSRAARGLAP